MFNYDGPSLSDIRAVTAPANNDAFGNGWWVIILLLALFGGWGRNNASGAVEGYTLASDFATLERKMDALGNGISDGFYANNSSLLNGFSNVTQTINNAAFANQAAINGLGQCIAGGFNGIQKDIYGVQSAMQGAACAIERGQDGINYNVTAQSNNIINAINQMTRDIIKSNDDAYRALQMQQISAQMSAKDETISALRNDLSQMAQNAYLVGQLSKQAVPAYVVPNPNCPPPPPPVANGCVYGNNLYH